MPKFDTTADVGIPCPSSWQLAMVDWSALNDKTSVWHYANRANPRPFGCRNWAFHQEIETGLGTYLHYKPRGGYHCRQTSKKARSHQLNAVDKVGTVTDSYVWSDFTVPRQMAVTWPSFDTRRVLGPLGTGHMH